MGTDNILTIPTGLTELIQWLNDYKESSSARLSRRELELLNYLSARPGQIVGRDELLAEVWKLDPKCTGTRTIDMHVANLRRKVRNLTGRSDLVQTVRGKGYRLTSSESAGPPVATSDSTPAKLIPLPGTHPSTEDPDPDLTHLLPEKCAP